MDLGLLLPLLADLTDQDAVFELTVSGASFIYEVPSSAGFSILYKSFIHGSALIPDGDLLRLIYFSLEKTSNILILTDLHDSAPFWSIIGPFSIVVELSLVLAEAVSHAFSELTHIDILACDQLSLSFV